MFLTHIGAAVTSCQYLSMCTERFITSPYAITVCSKLFCCPAYVVKVVFVLFVISPIMNCVLCVLECAARGTMEPHAFNQWKRKKKKVAAGLLLHLLLSLAHLSSSYLFHLVHPGRPLSFAFKAPNRYVHFFRLFPLFIILLRFTFARPNFVRPPM